MTSPDQPLPEGVDLREQVARIIDPEAFISIADLREHWTVVFREIDAEDNPTTPDSIERFARESVAENEPARIEAFVIADAILALPPIAELRALRLPGGGNHIVGADQMVPEGWVMVPRRRTDRMVADAVDAANALPVEGHVTAQHVAAIFHAMISAAPTPPASEPAD